MNINNTKSRFQYYVNNLYSNFISIAKQVHESRENPYEISGWVKKNMPEQDVLIYRVTATDKYISSFSVLDIYSNENLLLNFSKKEIKYISTLAVLLHYKKEPKYQLIWESFRVTLDSKVLQFKDRDNSGIIKKSIDDLERDIELIDGMSGADAFRLGKEVGIRERMREERFIRECV